MKRVLPWVLLLVYWGGCQALNENVRSGCTHGNCKHGWYSQDTGDERALYWLWALGFPIGIGALALYIAQPDSTSDSKGPSLPQGRPVKRVPMLEARARKEWSCSRCGRSIQPGDLYQYYEVWIDRFSDRVRYCQACAIAVHEE